MYVVHVSVVASYPGSVGSPNSSTLEGVERNHTLHAFDEFTTNPDGSVSLIITPVASPLPGTPLLPKSRRKTTGDHNLPTHVLTIDLRIQTSGKYPTLTAIDEQLLPLRISLGKSVMHQVFTILVHPDKLPIYTASNTMRPEYHLRKWYLRFHVSVVPSGVC